MSRVDSLNDCIPCDPNGSQDLEAAIDHSAEGLGAEDFDHAGLVAGAIVSVEEPRRVPYREATEMEIDLVVGDHEADALMLADRPAERAAAPCMVDRDRMTALSGAEPSHAVREARRPQPHLRIPEALTHLSEHTVRRHAHIRERDFGMAPGGVRIDRIEHPGEPETRHVRIEKKHRRAEVCARGIERTGHHDMNCSARDAGDHVLVAGDYKAARLLPCDGFQE